MSKSTAAPAENRARSVLRGYSAFAFNVLCLSSINTHWRLSGLTPGDPFQHFFAWIFASVEVSIVIHSRIVRLAPIQELELHAAMIFYMCICFPSYSCLSPYTTQHDVAFGVAAIAMTSLMYMAVVIYTSAEFGPTRMKLRYLYPVLCANQVAAFLRIHGEAVPELPFASFTVAILMAAIIHAGEHIEANIVRMRHSLNQEVERAETALVASQKAKADLEHLSHGMGRMLKALCDIVVYLDRDLRISNPSGQLQEFLTGQHGNMTSLEGRTILDFMQTDQDRCLVQSFLTPTAADGAGEGADCGAAGSFNVCVRDESGGHSRVQIFFARLAVGNFLLGLRIDSDVTKLLCEDDVRSIVAGGVAGCNVGGGDSGCNANGVKESSFLDQFVGGSASDEEKEKLQRQQKLQQQQQQQQEQQQQEEGAEAVSKTQSDSSNPHSGGKAVSEAESPVFLDAEDAEENPETREAAPPPGRNPSKIAVRFDASSDDFSVGGQSPLLNAPQALRMRPQALLRWVGPENQAAFEDWVVRSVQHAPWDKTATSEPFHGPLSITLPKVRARTVSVSKAWLETSPPDEYGDIWATLWLEGFENEAKMKLSRSSGGGRHPLATVEEETATDFDLEDDASSDASSSLGSDSTATRCL